MFWRQIESRVTGSGCLDLMHLAEALRLHHKEQLDIPQCLGLGILRH